MGSRFLEAYSIFCAKAAQWYIKNAIEILKPKWQIQSKIDLSQTHLSIIIIFRLFSVLQSCNRESQGVCIL